MVDPQNNYFWSRYSRLDRLAVGGMGEIWKAYDRDTGAVVALKVLHPHLSRQVDLIRFRREMHHLSLIRDPHVIRILDITPEYEHESVAYAMEYCPDGHLKRDNLHDPLTDFFQICKGVAALHGSSNRIIHRDLKPSNILRGADGNLKVSDLGLSVSLADEQTRPTTSNWVSPGYSPPEQFRNMALVDERGDVYSLGAILYYLFTGNDCHSEIEIEHPNIAPHVRPLLKVMLTHNANDRFPSAMSLLQTAHEYLSNTAYSLYRCPQCNGYGVAWAANYDGEIGFICCHCGARGSE